MLSTNGILSLISIICINKHYSDFVIWVGLSMHNMNRLDNVYITERNNVDCWMTKTIPIDLTQPCGCKTSSM